MLNVSTDKTVCHSPKMYDLRQILYAFFDKERVTPVMNGNNVNSYHVTIDPDKLDLFAKKLGVQGHSLTRTELEGIKHLQLKSGETYLVVVSDKFILIGNL